MPTSVVKTKSTKVSKDLRKHRRAAAAASRRRPECRVIVRETIKTIRFITGRILKISETRGPADKSRQTITVTAVMVEVRVPDETRFCVPHTRSHSARSGRDFHGVVTGRFHSQLGRVAFIIIIVVLPTCVRKAVSTHVGSDRVQSPTVHRFRDTRHRCPSYTGKYPRFSNGTFF